MNIDIENHINKTYQYFSIYIVRTEKLKEYCEFANCEYKKFLSHCKTRWLSLFPGTSRLLEMFSPQKSYFLSKERPPIVIKRFFENEMSEVCIPLAFALTNVLVLWMYSMFVFHGPIQVVERERNSIAEVLENLELVDMVLV